ncbi:DUF6234 family protein [Streptomyces roseoverticillatus]|uniref:DUF6234 family protein n=1 Tax=Streptomyces roseoverticillatus TaxID=66429 RepID=UPI001F3E4EDE|nr:DUF6234 family protein [Streptomyces roseoverticillatus]
MTYTLPEPSRRRRWPWSRRTPGGRDAGIGILLFIVEAAVYLATGFRYGMEIWAAQSDEKRIDATRVAELAWVQHFLIATVVLAGLALLFRAPWTVLSQLLAAGVVAVLLTLAQHDYDRAHPAPAPAPNPAYVPCYSGSGRCN